MGNVKPRGADVTVLGAGAAGCATAYFLARGGAEVKVVERNGIGSCASGNAVGLLNPLAGPGIPGPAQPLAEAAFKMHLQLWPELAEETGIDFQASTMPHLKLCLAPEEVLNLQEETRRWAETEGFAAQWLEPQEVLSLEPRVTRQLQGAVLLENVGVLDSYLFTLALARAAERQGAVFLNEEVTGLKSVESRITGVALSQGEIPCDQVVVAMGPWSSHATEWLRLDLPVEPLKGEILHLEGLDPPLRYQISGPCSLAHKADGLVWTGATEEHAGFDTAPSNEARELLMQRALRMMPCLEELRLLLQTACLRPVTPDRQPILGRAPGWEGVYLATGAETKGMLLSPAIGRAVADLIIHGDTSLPIAPFSPDRFAPSGGRG